MARGPGFSCAVGIVSRHSFSPYFEGSPRTYTDEMLKSFDEPRYDYNGQRLTEYEASQRQREIERRIRRWKRERAAMDAAGLDTSESAAKVKRWQDTQKDFLRQTGLKRQADREQIAGWGRGDAARASRQAQSAALTNAVGQRIIKAAKTSTHETPEGITQVVTSRGGISRNYYDSTGRWIRQITNNNHGNPVTHPYGDHGEHAHDIVWNEGKIVDRPIRDLTELERKENVDIL